VQKETTIFLPKIVVSFYLSHMKKIFLGGGIRTLVQNKTGYKGQDE